MLLNQIKQALNYDNTEYKKAEITITKIQNGFNIKYGRMYNSPELNFQHLFNLSILFGTRKINVDHYSMSGCETCDWDSSYGHDIQILEPTLNVKELETLANLL